MTKVEFTSRLETRQPDKASIAKYPADIAPHYVAYRSDPDTANLLLARSGAPSCHFGGNKERITTHTLTSTREPVPWLDILNGDPIERVQLGTVEYMDYAILASIAALTDTSGFAEIAEEIKDFYIGQYNLYESVTGPKDPKEPNNGQKKQIRVEYGRTNADSNNQDESFEYFAVPHS